MALKLIFEKICMQRVLSEKALVVIMNLMNVVMVNTKYVSN